MLRAWAEKADLGRDEVIKAIVLMKKSGEIPSVEGFEKLVSALRKEESRIEAFEAVDWYFVIPFAAVAPKAILPQHFQVLGFDFELTTWESADEVIASLWPDLGPMKNHVFRFEKKIPKAPDFVLVARASASNHLKAWQALKSSFDTFRGFCEFEFGQHRMHLQSLEEPDHFLPHPPWVITSSKRSLPILSDFRDRIPGAREIRIVGADFLKVVGENSKLLSVEPPKDSIESVIAAALRLYAQTRDEDADHRALLGYWWKTSPSQRTPVE